MREVGFGFHCWHCASDIPFSTIHSLIAALNFSKNQTSFIYSVIGSPSQATAEYQYFVSVFPFDEVYGKRMTGSKIILIL